ncbi:MAG: hypothetical protein WC859_08920 [Elusimicrobiota bacterium]|jgi:hypothetical protein
MLEFYPANKAYITTPLLGFRSFFRSHPSKVIYEPFQMSASGKPLQLLRIRPEEIEIEETNPALGLRIRVTYFNVPNETLPVLVRLVHVENIGRRVIKGDWLDGLPHVVPYGLNEWLCKHMSRTMEAFAQVTHADDRLPFFKLKTEPSDKPEVHWIHGGFFAFSLSQGKLLPLLVDPVQVFGSDTSFQHPIAFQSNRRANGFMQTESMSACALSLTSMTLHPGQSTTIQSYYGQADGWEQAKNFQDLVRSSSGYAEQKRTENSALIRRLMDTFSVHSALPVLDAYSRQAFLDNMLRGGQPFQISGPGRPKVFHYYSRKHGDMERDYNFFELSPTYFSQGTGNYRDVNQNRRSETFLYQGIDSTNIETFFNLIQLDGYNPLMIQFEKFYVPSERLDAVEAGFPPKIRPGWRHFLTKPFSPGELFERLTHEEDNRQGAQEHFLDILAQAEKIQDAAHGEGYWVDHWTYNLDFLESFYAVYPDRLRWLLVERRDFTYYDNDHVVQPRHKKYVRRVDRQIRQMGAVVRDPEKTKRLHQRKDDPFKVRTQYGAGRIYQTSLLAKILGLIGIKAATLDPFGVGIEMEAERPGWCDALNGLPGLIGSSTSEAFELRRWVRFLQEHLAEFLDDNETHAIAEEVAEFLHAVREALTLVQPGDFFKTWDTLASLREQFRERVRFGVSGNEVPLSRSDIEALLSAVASVLDTGLAKVMKRGLCPTYFINEVVDYKMLPATAVPDDGKPVEYVKALTFKQIPISPFLEGPVHALRVVRSPQQARKIYQAVRASALFDRKLKMYRLNVSLDKESYEIGRNKIFSPGWLENESIFLHMAYKFLLETLRSGLAKEFFSDLRNGLVAFQNPHRYGRSILENSSFIASSRFSDQRVHGMGFVARLTGATAEWISMLLHMGLGRWPFRWVNGELHFQPEPTLPRWFFSEKERDGFPPQSFGFRLFNRSWVVYHNPKRRDTFGPGAVRPVAFTVVQVNGEESRYPVHFLPDSLARALRDGKLERVTIELG